MSRSAGFAWSELIQQPPADSPSAERDQYDALVEALSSDAYSEAEISAKLMVEQAIAHGDNGIDRGRALHNLAVVQHAGANHHSAIQNYIASIDEISSEYDNLNAELVLPLRGLATAYLDTDQSSEAFSMFERASHISSVNYGPHSLNQLPILNSQMEFYMEQGAVESALDVLEHVYILYTRKFSRRSEEMLPALYQRADMFGRLKNYAQERRALRHILEIKQEHYAEDDLQLIEPNIRLAANIMRALRKDFMRSVSSSDAEKHLKRALRIARNSPEARWQVKLDCLLSLADFYTVFDMKARARRYYAEAWDLLSTGESLMTARSEHLEAPVPISQPRPDPYANFEYRSGPDNADPDDYLEGEITVSFTVNDRGRTADMRVSKADPPEFLHMERRVQNAVKNFIYRPRLIDGVPVAMADRQYRARYFYLQSDYRASLKKTAERSRTRKREESRP